MKLNTINTFVTALPSDPILENSRRQVSGACYSFVTPKQTKKPQILHTSQAIAKDLGVSEKDTRSEEFLAVFTGNSNIENTTPYAMCYGGHQFGNWAGQLGDGRAINLTEVEHNHKKWTLQLKGAGATPYSRTADGLAVLRSSVREYLCSEAMFHLGVPTTRALSLALSGDDVLRDVLYDGHPAYEKGAIVCRVSPTFLRFGSYEIHASRQDYNTLKTLVDYTITQHYPEIKDLNKTGYLHFFKAVSQLTLDMIIHWQRVGFVHGVMNTDNMSVLGLTIDYGPYGWLEGYDFDWTPNTTDAQHKRYRYGNQPNIGLWNLLQLANALYPLIEDAKALEAILNDYNQNFHHAYQQMMNSKLGLSTVIDGDASLIKDLEANLHLSETDMTIFFRNLSNFKKEIEITDDTIFLDFIRDSFYNPEELTGHVLERWKSWFVRYKKRLSEERLSHQDRKLAMNKVNPKYVLRNYMSQLAIDAADKGDYSLIDELYTLLQQPYDEQPKYQKWFAKRPEWARHKVGCSMLSCSS
ncbi:MAG: protein adenylyltransferase SelO [Flavobacteriaceae bacterium]